MFEARILIDGSAGFATAEGHTKMPRHEAQLALPYSPEQLFDLAADVESYPQFLPWWIAARIRQREGDVYFTDQIIGFGVVRHRFGSKTMLRRAERIDVTSTDRTFKKFGLTWQFDSLPDNGCRVTLVVDIELRSRLLQDLFHRAISRSVGSIMSAFAARARRLYDRSTEPRPRVR